MKVEHEVSPIPEIALEDFRTLLRQSGLPFDESQIEVLHEGYIKLRRIADSLERETEMTTGLALAFRPEAIS